MSAILEAAAAPRWTDVAVGTPLPDRGAELRLQDEVRYCGASHDFVGVHWNDRIAKSVELDAVVLHGPLTTAIALRSVLAWTGDPTAVAEYQSKLIRPVCLPDDDTSITTLRVTGVVEEKLDDSRVAVGLTVFSASDEVVATVRALVRLP